LRDAPVAVIKKPAMSILIVPEQKRVLMESAVTNPAGFPARPAITVPTELAHAAKLTTTAEMNAKTALLSRPIRHV
jgi:hypothetical protein